MVRASKRLSQQGGYGSGLHFCPVAARAVLGTFWCHRITTLEREIIFSFPSLLEVRVGSKPLSWCLFRAALWPAVCLCPIVSRPSGGHHPGGGAPVRLQGLPETVARAYQVGGGDHWTLLPREVVRKTGSPPRKPQVSGACGAPRGQ